MAYGCEIIFISKAIGYLLVILAFLEILLHHTFLGGVLGCQDCIGWSKVRTLSGMGTLDQERSFLTSLISSFTSSYFLTVLAYVWFLQPVAVVKQNSFQAM
jgi:hypothetical protein